MNEDNISHRIQDDFMTIGESGFMPTSTGWLVNPTTGEKIDPEGNHYNESGERIKDSE